VQGASHIAHFVHRNGALYRFDLEKSNGGVARQANIDPLLDYAVAQRWLVVNGSRVIPGDDPPDPLTSARFVPAGRENLPTN
jgi:kynureninase